MRGSTLRTAPIALAARPFLRHAKCSRLQARWISAYGYEQAKALVFKKHGAPETELSLHSHSISPAHSNQLTIRFLASPINPADINQIQGVYPTKPAFTTGLGTADPLAVAGNEGVAEVLSIGSAVKTLRKGDWVVMKAPAFGTWRTHAQTTEEHLLKIEDKHGLTPVQAGTVSVNPCTAYRMLKDFVQLEEGDWFIQNGANSGVGRAVIQLARLWRYRSINVIRARPEGKEALVKELEELGADLVVTDEELTSGTFQEKWKEGVYGGTNPIKLGLNCVGGKPASALSKQLAPGAHMVTYGGMSKGPVMIGSAALIFKDLSFQGFWVSRWSERNPEEKQKTVNELLQLMRDGKLKDSPMEEIPWDYETKQEVLLDAVKGTLDGYRKGKGIFVFGKT